jgi:hypothetical protein
LRSATGLAAPILHDRFTRRAPDLYTLLDMVATVEGEERVERAIEPIKKEGER